VGKYDALDAIPDPAAVAAPAAAAPSASSASPGGGKYALLDAPPASAPIDEPTGIGLSGPGSKDTDPTKLAPTEAAPRLVASESKVPGHQGEPERADSVVPELLSVLDGTKEGFRTLGRDAVSANRQLSNVILHPVDTLGDERFRTETMRGVNNAIAPVVGNKLVAAIGGPPEHSASDTAAFPDAQALGSAAGAFVPVPYGEIAAALTKSGKKAVGGLLGAVEKAGAGAEERQVGRAVEDITEGANKKARLGLEKSEDKVEQLARENPEIVAHARDNDALLKDAEAIRNRASDKLSGLYAERDVAEQEEERAAAARAEAQANPAGSGAREKAERDATEAQARADQFRRDAAKRISDRPAHGVSMAEPVSNMDASIARMEKGNPTDRLAAKELKRIRDELAESKGADGIISARELRDEQTSRQTIGYAKAMPGMADFEVTNAKILANRQASRDIGDSIVKHVTGMGYDEAKAAAAADPTSIAGRLFKLNGEIEGAARIQAAVASKKAASHGGMSDFIHFLFSHHGKRSGKLGAAALAAHELGAHKAAAALGVAATAVGAAPTVARYADNALAAAGRGAAKITPAAVSEVIDLAAVPTSTFQDVAEAAAKRGLPFAVARQIAREAGKAVDAAPMPGPAFAEQEASP
jgi:hypothetical protein